MSELKPCPFCGAEEAQVITQSHEFYPYSIRCARCGTTRGWWSEVEIAVSHWNTRAACPECERQRERANEAQRRVDVLQSTVDQKYRIHAELETALGVIHLEGDKQMAAALARVKALEAVAEAAKQLVVVGGTSARNTTSSIMACYRTDAIALEDALDALDAKGGK